MSSKTIETILRFVADEQAARKAIRVSEGVREALGRTAKQTLDIDAAANKLNAEFAQMARAKAISNLSAQAIEAAQETGDWATQLKRVATELSNIGASDDEIRRVAQSIGEAQTARSGSTGRSSGNAGNALDRIGSTGSQILSGLGQSDAANAVGLIGDLGGAIGSLNPVLLAGTAAAAAFTAITANAVAETNRVAEATINRAQAEREAAAFLREATREQTQARIAETRKAIEDELDALGQYTSARQEILDGLNLVDQARAFTGLAFGEMRSYDNLIAESNQSYIELSARLETLTRGLDEGATAAADAAAREQQLQAARDAQANSDIGALLAADQMTEAQRQQRINSINREIQVLQMYVGDSSLSSEATAELSARINNLQRESDILAAQSNTTADALARQAEATRQVAEQQKAWDTVVSSGVNALLAADKMTADQRQQRIDEINREIDILSQAAQSTNISSEYADQLNSRIAALSSEMLSLKSVTESTADVMAAAEARSKALSEQTDRYFDALEREGEARDRLLDVQKELIEVDTKAAAEAAKAAAEAETRRTEILADGAEQREELERKTQDALRKLDRDYNRDYFQAVAERDALAAAEAAIRRADALEDQKESDDEAQRRLDQAQQKQLRSLEKSLQDQGLRLAEAQQRERDTKQRAYLQAQNDLINAENATRNIQTTAIQGRVIREGNAYQQISSLVDFYMTAIVNRFTSGLQSMLGAVPGSPAAWDFYGMSTSGGALGAQIDARVDARMARAFRDAHR